MTKNTQKKLTETTKTDSINVHNLPAFDANQRRVFIYIDGSNFYHRLKGCDIFEGNFRYKEFLEWLIGQPLQTVRYYVGLIRRQEGNEKAENLYRSQQKRFERLKKEGFYLVRGKMMPIGDTFVEKGVDVRIAIDLVVGALEDMYDEAYVLSSDSDLVPAIEHITRKTDKKVHYIAFEGSNHSIHLSQKATSMRMIKKDELLNFGEEFKQNNIS
jgi:uncharacterized LabA/DUF88 family protein